MMNLSAPSPSFYREVLAGFPALELEGMTPADLEGVTALEAITQPFPWRRVNFADSLTAGHAAWVLRQGGDSLGFMVLMLAVDEAHLLNVAVTPVRQRQGLGARLLRHGMAWSTRQGMKSMLLEVRPSNTRALALYRHLGFVEVGRRKAYYPAPAGREDALILSRMLEDVLP
ncbi:MAG: ribosomal protein S18-alanine N-acetyltransferase [Zoogloeaceae bacterium]|jgi:ribosomal-protein-alanine acetyltransferase|nr:ribosomal protein S18-alanine N-acetyltransferase [Zoogloeaceae bacterium]